MKNLLRLSLIALFTACPAPPAQVADPNVIEVVSFTPQGTTETQPIDIIFSGSVIEDAKIGQDAPGLVTLTPSIPGRAVWLAADRLRFIPSEPFPKATKLIAKLGRIDPPGGRRFGGDTQFEFSTEMLLLRGVEPFYTGVGTANVRLNVELTLPVTPEAAKAAIAFTGADGNAVQATLETTQPGTVMAYQLAPITVPESDTQVSLYVVIKGTLAPSFGGLPLGVDIKREVTLRRPVGLLVEQAYPEQQGKEFSIVVRFNDEVDVDAATRAITVKPAVKVQVLDEYRAVRLNGPFKAGQTYEIKVQKGLIGSQGGALVQEISRTVIVADLEPQLRFAHEGSYLAKSGNQKIAVDSVNVAKVVVSVDKVFENNLVHVLPRLRSNSRYCGDDGCYGGDGEYEYYGEGSYNSYYELGTFGTSIVTGSIELGNDKNQWKNTVIPFPEIDKDARAGLYRLRIADAERSWSYVEKWVLSTDLGLTAKVGREEARITVVSLATLQPVAGVDVSFHSSTNQLLGKVTSDAQGVATISLAGMKPNEPLSVITAQKSGDFSYLALASTSVPTADFDVGGDGDTTAPYEAYAYLDRGVYRPGDTVRVSVIVRDKAMKTPPAFPYTVEIRNPQWRLFSTLRATTANDGLTTFDIPLPNDALTGNYALRVLGASDDTVLGRETIKVEEFMPDRIKVEVQPSQPMYEADTGIAFDVSSNYLFGPPAKGLRLQAVCSYSQATFPGEWASTFSFNSDGAAGYASEVDKGETELDDEGKATLECDPVAQSYAARPVRVSLVGTVSENGGRAVTGVGSALVHPHPYYVGVRRNSTSYTAEVDKSAEVEAVVVDREGKAKSGVKVTAKYFKVNYRTVVKLVNGRNQYVSEREETAAGEGSVTSGERPVPVSFVAKSVGQYRIQLSTPEGGTTSIEVYVSGSGYAGWDMKNPDKISMTLDKDTYGAGETAKVMVRAPFAGQLYITVERDKVLWQTTMPITGNTISVNVPVGVAMTPNAYIVAQVVRGPMSAEKLAPMRAFGVVPLAVKSDAHKLDVKLAVPETMRPSQPLEVEIATNGGKGSVQVTLAAVDEGILRITDFHSPDPFKFFTRKRRLGISTHDLFDALLPEVDGRSTSIVRTQGGDAARSKHLNPVSVKRVKPVALWSGVVKLDASGKGKIKVDMPQFQGSVRVMVVAVEGDKFGAAEKNVTVRDPLVLTPTLPRFVGPLDKFKFPIEVYNGTGANADVKVSVEIEGRIEVMGEKVRTLKVANGAQEMTVFELTADEVAGKAKITVRASSGDVSTWSETEIGIRPAATVSMDGVNAVVKAGAPLKVKVPSGYLPGTLHVSITAGPAPAAQFGAALQYLIQYPYGCLEQTTSKAFPLIYLKDVAKTAAPDLVKDGAIDQYVQAGISRVESMVVSSGGLSYWPGNSWGYPWTTVYATHFLVEAKKAGYPVDEAQLKRLLDHLAGVSNAAVYPVYGYAPDYKTQAYALYVLALAGRSNVSTLSYAVDLLERSIAGKVPPNLRAWADEETKAFLAGALLLSGDRVRASNFVSKDFSLAASGPQQGFWSAGRADAVILGVLAEVDPDHKSVPKLMKSLIDRSKNGHWYNTQENAFALVALGKIARKMGSGDYTGTIKVGGKDVQAISSAGGSASVHGGDDWVGQEIEIAVTGAAGAFTGVTFEGIKAGLQPARAKGIEVERAYFDKAGKRIDSSKVEQGQVVFVRLGVKSPGASRIENVALVDLLPAGLEIENPRLGAEQITPWMETGRSVADYVDIRDDRILMFFHVAGGAWQYYWYAARAVSEGDFVLPHVHVEAMYDPETQAQSGAGRMTVGARK